MDILSLFDQTKQAFSAFQEKSQRHHYPSDLKENALRLLECYSAPALAKHLGISAKSLLNWQNQKEKSNLGSKEFIDFAMNPISPDALATSNACQVTLQISPKFKLKLPASNPARPATLVHAVVKEFG